MKAEYMKKMAPLTEPPTVEEFAQEMRKDGGWRNVRIGNHFTYGDFSLYLEATLKSDGSVWQWDRAEGFISAQYVPDGSLWHWDRNSGFTMVGEAYKKIADTQIEIKP